MVSKSHAKRRQDIKTKLMAAIAMLLVSSIMMVSSTYAWFTLSTAPEVTGINTQVGANGNLEMALMPMNGWGTEGFGITSSVGNSEITENYKKNITWGNLVNLDDDFYGLEQITLYPAKLALDENDTSKIAGWWLETPSYGADGRVAALEKNATTSAFDSTAGKQNFSGGKMELDGTEYNLATAMGVRAVGNASGMSDREIALRNARSAAANAMSGAKVAASSSLNANGVALANIAIKHGTDSAAKHSQAEVTALLGIVNALIGTDGNSGIIGTIESAYLNYIIAYAASSESRLSDEQYAAFQGTIAGKSLSEVVDLIEDGIDGWTAGNSLPTEFGSKISDLAATKKNVVDAKAALEALRVDGTDINDETNTIEWSAISAPLYKLCNTNALKINDKYDVSNIKQDISGVMSSYANEGLNISIASGGGVYADIADHCGNYDAAIVIDRITYNPSGAEGGGISVDNVKASMKTKSTVTTAHLAALGSYAAELSAPEAGENTEKPITDTYGYIIDLAFRTNAAESNLLLQTDATGRIYGTEGSEETMGHGSTMTFTTTAVGFTADQMKGLMGCINLVFFDPADSNKVLATAKLDVANATVTGGNTVTANLYLYEYAEESYETATTFESGKTYYTLEEGVYTEATGITEFAENTTYYTKVAAGYQKLTGDNAVITALNQGVAKAVSVLVYLDGETITNADVAATAAMSMTGTLNLQFASSATLVPMEYTPLMNQTGTGTETGTETPTPDPAG